MIQPTLHWFHIMLGHSGSCCMCATLQYRYHHPHLHMVCNECQHAKPSDPVSSPLPDWDILGAPWEENAVDLI